MLRDGVYRDAQEYEHILDIDVFHEIANKGYDADAQTKFDGKRKFYKNDKVVSSLGLLVPVLHVAMYFENELLIRSMARRGFDLDAFEEVHRVNLHGGPTTVELTALGAAIRLQSTAMIRLCIDLGCSSNAVHRQVDSRNTAILSGVCYAVISHSSVSLAYLLDYDHPERPVFLSSMGQKWLAWSTLAGKAAIETFHVLEARGFDFHEAGEKLCLMYSKPLRFADLLYSNACMSEDPLVLRYISKELGLVSDSRRVMATCVELGYLSRIQSLAGFPSESAMAKLCCVSCEAIGATKVCSGCEISRYCCVKCQRQHWRFGGHKRLCKAWKMLFRKESSEVGGSKQSGHRRPMGYFVLALMYRPF